MDETSNLMHFGVMGMRWGRRKGPSASSSGSGGRKTSFAKDADGRKVNRILGKRNRTKIRNFFLGDAKAFIRDNPIMRKKYDSLSKQDRAKMQATTSKVLAGISLVSMAAIGALLVKG